MRSYQKGTNSPQMVAVLLPSRATLGGHFTRGRHQVQVMADRDRAEGIANGLGRTKFGFTPGKLLGAANEQITELRRPSA